MHDPANDVRRQPAEHGYPPIWSALAQHVLAAAWVFLVPITWRSFRSSAPAWQLDAQSELWFPVMGAVCYLAVAALITWLGRRRTITAKDLVAATAAGLLLLYLAALLAHAEVPRSSLVLTTATFAAAAFAVTLYPRVAVPRSLAMTLGVMGLLAWQAMLATADPYRRSVVTKSTEFYKLDLQVHSGFISPPARPAGGIALVGDRLLLATGAGELFLIERRLGHERLRVQPLGARVPLNASEFDAAVAELDVASQTFRVADIHAESSGQNLRVFASHHYWHGDRRCFVMRLSELTTTLDGLASLSATTPWRTVFESTPCLPVEDDSEQMSQLFEGNESGGRIGRLDERTLLLTLGDFRFNGVERRHAVSQDPAASYGKVIAIDTGNWSARNYSIGHRNPQGLHIDAVGNVWSTEHGARGGDELNHEREGGNYGWPQVTYGTQYAALTWPTNPRQGSHEGFDKPVFAWVPSIGISNLLRVTSYAFGNWAGDLLVASLKDQSLWRVHLEDGDRAVVTERIEVGHRIRDLLELPTGELALWSDSGTLIIITPSADGATFGSSFADCMQCHPVGDGTSHGLGPDLSGIAQRGVASAAGFSYSDGLKRVGGAWTRERLDHYLADPQGFAPGTSMTAPKIDDAAHRRALVDHLLTLE
jgi:cytochrome c2